MAQEQMHTERTTDRLFEFAAEELWASVRSYDAICVHRPLNLIFATYSILPVINPLDRVQLPTIPSYPSILPSFSPQTINPRPGV